MNRKPLAALTLSLILTTSAFAVEPNIEPGMWETTSTVTLKSAQFSMPGQTQTQSECITAEKVAEGQAFLEQEGDCTFAKKDLRSDGMDYSITCEGTDAGTMTMNASMQFNGKTMTGKVDGTMESPMGQMTMIMELSGRRTGSCSR
ncbi:MAG: DUF3617 family protein [Halieaceae bacterium]|nr:DUF3617 family protein [Halieaceae bacterium]